MRKGVDLHEGPNLHVCNADESLVSRMLILMRGREEQEPQRGRAEATLTSPGPCASGGV